MSLVEKVNGKDPKYSLVIALICMALALVIAKYSRQQLLVHFSSVPGGTDAAQVRTVTDLDGE
jgi:hypothetical protein